MSATAKEQSCPLLYKPTDPQYEENIRQFQGCPTIAVSKKGRIFLGWYSGGNTEPHIENYNLLVYSDDDGKTWSKPLLVIPSSKERLVHALDIQLFLSPEGKLFVFWVQNDVVKGDTVPENCKDLPAVTRENYLFKDFVHAEWVTVCDDPDADAPVFSAPRYVDSGFLRCKPLVVSDGKWINFNYDQTSDRYGYSISTDKGATYTRYYGGRKVPTPFDESMAYEKKNGDIRMFARTKVGKIAESISHDGGYTWTDGRETELPNPDTRLYVGRTPSGNVLLVNSDDSKVRKNLTLYLSEDDGETWKYRRCIDGRLWISYPDVDFYGGKIYLTYDRERTGAKEILFACFTEEDIKDPTREVSISIVSKP